MLQTLSAGDGRECASAASLLSESSVVHKQASVVHKQAIYTVAHVRKL